MNRPPPAPFHGNLNPARKSRIPGSHTCPSSRRHPPPPALPPTYDRKRQDGGTQSWRPLPACALAGATRVDTGRTSDVRVLVVEDEQLLADAVATGLRREAMAVDVVYDGAAALERIGVNDYDVVVLDRDLPLVHGDDVCRKIVELGMPTRVLMLTASGDVSDRVEGLEIGADDYLPKPFAFSELTARV